MVWFGESSAEGAWESAARESQAADLIIVAGTSLAVYPAASLARVGEGGVTVIEVNPDASGGPNVLALRAGTESRLARDPSARPAHGLSGRLVLDPSLR